MGTKIYEPNWDRIQFLMKKFILLSLFIFFQCSEIVYEHEADFDFEKYQKVSINNWLYETDYLSTDDVEYLINEFRKDLLEKSGFTEIYLPYYSSGVESDCYMEIRIIYIDRNEDIDDNGDGKISIETKIDIKVYDSKTNALILSFTKKGEGNKDFSRYDSTDERIRLTNQAVYDSVKEGLEDTASQFLKDLKI